MNGKRKITILILAFGMMLPMVIPLLAQSEPGTSNRKPYPMDSGNHTGLTDESYVAYRDVIEVPKASELRLHFSDYNLGSGSYIKITSVRDGATQHLNARSIVDYHNSSAYFNGDAVEIELYVVPGDENIFFRMEEVTAGKMEEGEIGKLDLCGDDNRISTTNPAIGRLYHTGPPEAAATAFIIMNGALMSAKHINLYAVDLVEFNCPSSLDSGTTRRPSPSHQYTIDEASIVTGWGRDTGDYGAKCQDYAIFNCNPNSETGLLPLEAQKAFYRIVNDEYFTSTVRVTGYGYDNTPAGDGPDGQNSDNYTLQTDAGAFIEEEETVDLPGSGRAGAIIKYVVDTMGGNSGSPVEKITPYFSRVAIGIQTFGGCNHADFYHNEGTGFDNDFLINDVKSFNPPLYSMVFLDKGHPSGGESGSIWNPARTLSWALTIVDPGGTIVIGAGTYGSQYTSTIDENVTLKAVGGTVTLD